MRRYRPPEEKPLHWVGSSKKDLLGFPEEVVDKRLRLAKADYEERYGKATD